MICLVKDLSEILKLVKLEGEQKRAEDIVGLPIIIEGFTVHKSKLYDSDFLGIQGIDDFGKKFWFNIGSQPVIETLKSIEGSLPVRCKLEKRTGDKGFDYYILVSAKPSAQGE